MNLYLIEFVNALGIVRTTKVEAASREEARALVEKGGQYLVIACGLL
jgi:hypothetical protein